MMQFKEAPAFEDGPKTHTTQPIVTGTSVLAVRYKDGVMMMADTLGSYGGLAMFKNLPRIQSINSTTLLGAGGEYSDLQHINRLLAQLVKADYTYADGAALTPREIHSYLTRVLYNRRSKVDPLWNTLLVAGVDFLGCVDIYGSSYEGTVLATGYGQHLALPLLRKHARVDMSEAEAKQLLEDCERVLLYRDCRTLNLFQIGTITAEGPKITEPESIETKWEFKRFVDPNDAE